MSTMTMQPEAVETSPYIIGDRLAALVKVDSRHYDYWPARVTEVTYMPRAPFGKHWLLKLAITAPSGVEVSGMASVDFNGTGYDVPGRPSTRPLVEED